MGRPHPPAMTAGRLRELLLPVCRDQQVDLAGVVALPRPLPHADAWLTWVAAGLHGDLDYMAREPQVRADPRREWPWARSLLVFGQRYTNGWRPDDPEAAGGCAEGRPWLTGVSRYARGRDYHDVLRRAIRTALQAVRREVETAAGRGPAGGGAVRVVERVDAGPFLEREWAWLAGFGFFGKNTLLIHPRLGSGLFLGVAVTDLEVTALADAPRPLVGPPPRPAPPPGGGLASLCGRCTRCLDACPTGALTAPYRLDAGRCLSTWSIEWRGGAPPAERSRQGGLLFGCDVCQQVCPWNHKAARLLTDPPPGAYAPLPEHAELSLADLLVIDAETFRRRFRRTPLWRCHPEGMRRNALVVAANTARRDLLPVIRRVARDDPDPGVRETARWALARLAPGGGADEEV